MRYIFEGKNYYIAIFPYLPRGECMYVWMDGWNISGGVANISHQSCAQIDNNQQVYEAPGARPP